MSWTVVACSVSVLPSNPYCATVGMTSSNRRSSRWRRSALSSAVGSGESGAGWPFGNRMSVSFSMEREMTRGLRMCVCTSRGRVLEDAGRDKVVRLEGCTTDRVATLPTFRRLALRSGKHLLAFPIPQPTSSTCNQSSTTLQQVTSTDRECGDTTAPSAELP